MFQILLIQFHEGRGLLLFLVDEGSVIQGLLIESLQARQLFLHQFLLLIVLERIHEMRQSGEGAQGCDYIRCIAEEIIADIELIQFLQWGHVGGQQLQAIAIEGERFQVFELGEDGHHELQVIDLPV